MLHAAEQLETILNETPAQLLRLTEAQAGQPPAPGKWSAKEILGHLIDSAANNHQRFVRLQLENNLNLLQYEQNGWVNAQQYVQRSWSELVELWLVYNRHLLHVLKHADMQTLQYVGHFPTYGTQTLQFIIDDYVVHLEHHLKQIFSLYGQQN